MSKLIALALTLLGVGMGGSQLVIQSVGPDQRVFDPSNIVVGLASDLAVQVQCISQNHTGLGHNTEWEYRNGTEVPSGLQPFGISQGEEGILRVYPASQLMTESDFICSTAGTNGSTQYVHFTLGSSLFFTSSILSQSDNSSRLACSIPDIPTATVELVKKGDSAYCVVESKRGVYRTATPAIVTNSEIIVPEGNTLQPLQLNCTSQGQLAGNPKLIMNNVTLSSPSTFFPVNAVNRSDSGFYQCSVNFNSLQVLMDSFYLLVAYVGDLMITPSFQTAVIGTDSTLVYSCSVLSNPLPRLSWSISRDPSSSSPPGTTTPQASLQSTHFPTNFGAPALSNVSVNISSLGVGDYVLTCSANINEVPALSASSSINLSVGVVFDNITMTSSESEVIIGIHETVNISCSVHADMEPSFVLSRDGIGLLSVQMQEGSLFQSETILNTSDFNIGTEIITCMSTLDTPSPNRPFLMANISINVDVVFENISIAIPENSQMIILSTENFQDALTLNCSVLSGRTPQMSWRRNNSNINSATPILKRGNTYISMVTLNISTLRPPSEDFQCTASLSAERQLTSYHSIHVGVILHNITRSMNYGILHCEVESSLVPIMTWTRNGVDVTGTQAMRGGQIFRSSLPFNRTWSKTELVVFECTASLEGRLAKPVSAKFFFNLRPTVMVNGHPRDNYYNIGLQLNLTCQVKFNETLRVNLSDNKELVSISWSKRGSVINPTRITTLSSRRIHMRPLTYMSILMFSSLSRNDEGIYVCSANLLYLRNNQSITVNHSVIIRTIKFQLKFSIPQECSEWINRNPIEKKNDITTGIVNELRSHGVLIFSRNTITDGGFLCFYGPSRFATYRATIHSTCQASALELINKIQDWVSSNSSTSIQGQLTPLDPKCTLVISSLSDGECNPQKSEMTRDSTHSGYIGGIVTMTIVTLATIIALIIAVGLALRCRHRHLKQDLRESKSPDICKDLVAQNQCYTESLQLRLPESYPEYEFIRGRGSTGGGAQRDDYPYSRGVPDFLCS